MALVLPFLPIPTTRAYDAYDAYDHTFFKSVLPTLGQKHSPIFSGQKDGRIVILFYCGTKFCT